ncbi:MAG: glycosyltransferase family 9 protein [Desulfovibrionaceae bacterium]|nr:glycosyltransferase family 9 protein [Desulfovibrionaceae bacterium]
MKKALVVRLSAIGDAVLVTGVIKYWHRMHGRKFDILTRKGIAPIFANHPAVDSVIALEDEELKFPRIFRVFREIASQYCGGDLLDLHDNLRTHLLSLMWKGRILRYPHYAFARRMFLHFKNVPAIRRPFQSWLENTNVPQRYAMALEGIVPERTLLKPSIFLTQEEKMAASEALRRHALYPDAPWIAVHPFAAHETKTWPLEVWKRVADCLVEQGYNLLTVGRGSVPSRHWPGFCCVNSTTLRELAALLGECRMLMTGDSGPMHLASAVETPVLAVFGPTVRAWGFFPEGSENRILEKTLPCRPCSLHGNAVCPHQRKCLYEPDQAVQELLRIVGDGTGNISPVPDE